MAHGRKLKEISPLILTLSFSQFVLSAFSLVLNPAHRAVSQAQYLVKKYVPHGTSLVDELIKSRRQEADND